MRDHAAAHATNDSLDQRSLAYPIDDLAERLGVGRTTLYAEIRAGRLRAKKLGKRTIIPAQAARAYLDSLPDVKAAT